VRSDPALSNLATSRAQCQLSIMYARRSQALLIRIVSPPAACGGCARQSTVAAASRDSIHPLQCRVPTMPALYAGGRRSLFLLNDRSSSENIARAVAVECKTATQIPRTSSTQGCAKMGHSPLSVKRGHVFYEVMWRHV